MAWHNLITAAVLGVVVGAGSVYKWVDEDGNVHYGERPPQEQSKDAEKVRIEKGPSDSDDEAAGGNDEDTTGGEEENGEPDDPIQKQQCKLSRDILERYQSAEFLYREGEDGEKRRLTEEEKQAEIERVKNDIRKFCNSGGS